MLIYSENPSAGFNYEILDKYEAGIVLTGAEVKSIKTNGLSLKSSYVKIMSSEEVYLLNSHISKYKPASNTQQNYDPERSRKLLLNKREINKLIGKVQDKGLTIVPLKVYANGRNIKIEIALARGKKLYDKRDDMKKKEEKRRAERAVKLGEY